MCVTLPASVPAAPTAQVNTHTPAAPRSDGPSEVKSRFRIAAATPRGWRSSCNSSWKMLRSRTANTPHRNVRRAAGGTRETAAPQAPAPAPTRSRARLPRGGVRPIESRAYSVGEALMKTVRSGTTAPRRSTAAGRAPASSPAPVPSTRARSAFAPAVRRAATYPAARMHTSTKAWPSPITSATIQRFRNVSTMPTRQR